MFLPSLLMQLLHVRVLCKIGAIELTQRQRVNHHLDITTLSALNEMALTTYKE